MSTKILAVANLRLNYYGKRINFGIKRVASNYATEGYIFTLTV